MAYLIDGNNLIGHLSDLSLKDRQSREKLILRLQKFQAVKNTRIILVFDGPPDPDLGRNGIPNLSLTIRFPDYHQNADGLIRDIIDRQTDLRRFFVVSSDREIRDYARSRKARILTSEEFEKELKQAAKTFKQKAELDKNVPPPTPLEVSHWENLFSSSADRSKKNHD